VLVARSACRGFLKRASCLRWRTQQFLGMSGAITGRAPRTTGFTSFTTPDGVGPGSYVKQTDREVPVHGFAPFSSTTERAGVIAKGSEKLPGPGAYTTTFDNTLGRTPLQPNGVPSGAGASFSSKVTRIPGGLNTLASQPGPGQYEVAPAAQLFERVGKPSLAGGAGRRATPKPVRQGPPSIPVREQSFGYEDAGTGELRMQQPPEGGYSGVSGRRSAGPGEYEPTKATALIKPAPICPNFGNSRVLRAVFAESSDTPGPGAYTSAEADGRRVKSSANFLSRTPLAYQKLIDPEKLVPGPGSYSAPPSIVPKAVPENLQAFGSTQKRLSSDALTPFERARMAQPGPGAYEERRTLAGAVGATQPGTLAQPPTAERAGRSGFNSSTVRFIPLQKGDKPGPGQYDANDQQSFVAALGRKPHGRNGVFGSTTRRFHALKQDPVPGAGAYNPVTPGENEAERDEGPSSAFASGVQRFTKSAPTRVSSKTGRDKDPVPPPWQYYPRTDNAWEGTHVHQGAASAKQNRTFLSTVERFPAGEMGGGTKIPTGPGPGQYAPKHPHDGFRKQQTTAMCFGTKEGRFDGPRGVFSGVAPTPGPGQYESAEIFDPLIKRSFNITIG